MAELAKPIKIDENIAVALKSLNGDMILVNNTIVYIKYAYIRTVKETKRHKTRNVYYIYAAEIEIWSNELNGYYNMHDEYLKQIVEFKNLRECRADYLEIERQILKMREKYPPKKEGS